MKSSAQMSRGSNVIFSCSKLAGILGLLLKVCQVFRGVWCTFIRATPYRAQTSEQTASASVFRTSLGPKASYPRSSAGWAWARCEDSRQGAAALD